MRILLVEDDPETAEYLDEGLRGENHELQVVADGRSGLLRAAGEAWDLLIIDRMLPGLDGLALVRTLRASGITTPVLFLTTMGGIDDRVTGLNAGGDDYLVKPFAFAELVARVNALGRRPQGVPVGNRPARRRPGDGPAGAHREARRPVGRAAAARVQAAGIPDAARGPGGDAHHAAGGCLGLHFDPKTNIVDSHISRLRGKVDRGHPELIHTVRGAGYCVRAPS